MTSLARNHFAPHQRNWKFAVGTSEENRRRRRVVREKGKNGAQRKWQQVAVSKRAVNILKMNIITFRKVRIMKRIAFWEPSINKVLQLSCIMVCRAFGVM